MSLTYIKLKLNKSAVHRKVVPEVKLPDGVGKTDLRFCYEFQDAAGSIKVTDRMLGVTGSEGRVYLALYDNRRQIMWVAIKLLLGGANCAASAENEVNAHRALGRSPVFFGLHSGCCFSKYFFVVMPFFREEDFYKTYLVKNIASTLDANTFIEILLNLTQQVQILFLAGMAYIDFKPENIVGKDWVDFAGVLPTSGEVKPHPYRSRMYQTCVEEAVCDNPESLTTEWMLVNKLTFVFFVMAVVAFRYEGVELSNAGKEDERLKFSFKSSGSGGDARRIPILNLLARGIGFACSSGHAIVLFNELIEQLELHSSGRYELVEIHETEGDAIGSLTPKFFQDTHAKRCVSAAAEVAEVKHDEDRFAAPCRY